MKNNENKSNVSHLIIDVDTSLERLYGGFYSDWLAGGEWTHLYSYIVSLIKSCQELSLCLIFCFDGTLYRYGQSQWYEEQIQQRKKVNQIFKHLKQNKSGLPRRNFWLSPAAFQLCLRMILRELNSPNLIIFQTWGYGHGQHQQQLKTYANQYRSSLLGVVSSDIDFFFPQIDQDQMILLRYFSSKHFKLSMKGKITLMEIHLNQFKEKFAFDQRQLALLFALLGNQILSDSDLFHFHSDLLRDQDHSTPSSSKRVSLKSNGTISPPIIDASLSDITVDLCSPETNTFDTSEDQPQTSSVTSPVPFSNQNRTSGQQTPLSNDPLISRLVDFVRKQNLSGEIDFDDLTQQIFKHLTDNDVRQTKKQLLIDAFEYYLKAIENNHSASDSSNTIESSSQISVNKSDDSTTFEQCSHVNQDILRTAFNLHQQGLLMPWVFQCLYKREITLPVTIEPEMCNTMPNICEFYRPIRQYLYSILFNQSTIVREQAYNSEHGSYLTEISCEPLKSTELTIEQLWFGTKSDEDRQKRLKTFLQSLHFCDLPRFYTVSHEYLLLVCALRFIYMGLSHHSTTTSLIHIYELMAFIAQAVLITESQPKSLINSQTTNILSQYEHIQIVQYETRPVQLAHLFMRGLETILFANEVCGAPIHSKYACPWHFFSGKLFHQKYLQAQYYQQNQDLFIVLCDGNTHCAEMSTRLLDVVLDRSSNGPIPNTPLQQQQHQYQAGPMPQQQRLGKQFHREPRPQGSLANSIRPVMRTLNKPNVSTYQQHRTPVTNHRQQIVLPAPPVKQTGLIRNGSNRIHTSATPFNAKQMLKFNPRTTTPIQYAKPYPKDQWNNNPLPLPPHSVAPTLTQHQQPYPTMNPMQQIAYPIPIVPQPMNISYLNPLDEQFAHLQMHSSPLMTSSPMSYTPIPSMMNSPIPPGSFTQLAPPYGIPAGATFYQPSPTSTGMYPHPLVTPYHSTHPSMMSGVPPHAPMAPQRTVNFANVVPQNSSQRISPSSIATPELHLQVLQQRMHHDQATPISVQRQMTRIPSNDYTQYDLHRSTSNNGQLPAMTMPLQSHSYPSMIAEHPSRVHGQS